MKFYQTARVYDETLGFWAPIGTLTTDPVAAFTLRDRYQALDGPEFDYRVMEVQFIEEAP